MSEKKNLKEEDLEKVSGGWTYDDEVIIGWYHYKDSCYGKILNIDKIRSCRCNRCTAHNYWFNDYDRCRVTKMPDGTYETDYFRAQSTECHYTLKTQGEPFFLKDRTD